MLDPADGLDLVGVGLGAVLIVVPELSLASVSLQDVLVSTVAGELIGHPAVDKERKRRAELSVCFSLGPNTAAFDTRQQ